MHQKFILFLICILSLTNCQPEQEEDFFDIQGHRGCRGYLPENTIAGFIKAIDLGVTTLEMDVVISKDKKVVVSHEPWISEHICMDSMSRLFTTNSSIPFNIYELNYSSIKKFDCGLKKNRKFPTQKARNAIKPLLTAVIDTAESHLFDQEDRTIYYNIEIKSRIDYDNIYHPPVDEYVDLVMAIVKSKGITKKTTIQSFDPRVLNYVHDEYPKIKTAYLTDNQLGYSHNLSRLDFTPTIFSPDKAYVTQGMIDFFHKEGIKVIPWTVNRMDKMKELMALGVDGIITDYPDRLVTVVNEAEEK